MTGRPARRARRFSGGAGWLVVLLAAAAAAQAPDVPPLTGRVVDRADLLSPATEAALADVLAAHERSTGHQVAVLTVLDLGGEAVEPYATRVLRAWGLGGADRDDGVLLVVARDERAVRIEVGYGLEGSLTDAAAGRIVRDDVVPRFRDGDFDGGVLAAVDAVVGRLDGDPTAAVPLAESPPSPATARAARKERWAAAVLVLGVFAYVLWRNLEAGFEVGEEGEYVLPVVVVSVPFVAFGVLWTGWWAFLALPVVAPFVYVEANRWLERHPARGPARRARRRTRRLIRKARAEGKRSVTVGGVVHDVPSRSRSGSRVGSGGRSGGSSSGRSSGGFSGRGGSSGGGGASGRW